MVRLSTGDELSHLPMPTVEVEVYHEWWEFDNDTFPPLSLLTFPHHGGILSWWEYAMICANQYCHLGVLLFITITMTTCKLSFKSNKRWKWIYKEWKSLFKEQFKSTTRIFPRIFFSIRMWKLIILADESGGEPVELHWPVCEDPKIVEEEKGFGR